MRVTRLRTVGRPLYCSREEDFRDINVTAEQPLIAAFIVQSAAPSAHKKLTLLRRVGVKLRR